MWNLQFFGINGTRLSSMVLEDSDEQKERLCSDVQLNNYLAGRNDVPDMIKKIKDLSAFLIKEKYSEFLNGRHRNRGDLRFYSLLQPM